jgi:phage FluMu protein Com
MGRREKHRRSSMQKSSDEREWRCRKCRSLLGMERSGRLHLKYKDAQFVVEGKVMAVCRRCSELNETESHRHQDARSIARA